MRSSAFRTVAETQPLPSCGNEREFGNPILRDLVSPGHLGLGPTFSDSGGSVQVAPVTGSRPDPDGHPRRLHRFGDRVAPTVRDLVRVDPIT